MSIVLRFHFILPKHNGISAGVTIKKFTASNTWNGTVRARQLANGTVDVNCGVDDVRNDRGATWVYPAAKYQT